MEFLTRSSFSEDTEPHSIIIRCIPHPTPRLLDCRRDKRRAHKWGLHGVRFLSYSIHIWSRINWHNHTLTKTKSARTDTLTERSAVFRQWVSDWQSSEQLQKFRTSKIMFCAKSPKNVRQVWSTSQSIATKRKTLWIPNKTIKIGNGRWPGKCRWPEISAIISTLESNWDHRAVPDSATAALTQLVEFPRVSTVKHDSLMVRLGHVKNRRGSLEQTATPSQKGEGG